MDRLTIRAQITILAGLLGVILVSAAAGMAMYLAQKRETVVAEDRLQTLAAEIARALDLGMFERYREIRGLADLDTNHDFWISDPRDARSVLDALQRSLPEYAWIGVASPDGIIRSATQGMFEGTDVSDRPWFSNGRHGPFVGDAHDGNRLTDLARTDADLYQLVNITVPIRDGRGELVGVIGARLNWSWAREIKQRLVDPDLMRQSTQVWFLSRDGSVLLGPDSNPLPPDRIAAMLGAARGAALRQSSNDDAVVDGYAVAQGFHDMPGLGWIVFARQPATIALAIARSRAIKIAMIGGTVAILGLFLFAMIGGRIARPIMVLTDKADRIGREPSVGMFPRLGGSREVELLSGALRSLLRRIGDAELQTARSEELRVEEGRLHDERVGLLRRLADTDPLTGLLNRRSLEQNAAAAIEHFRRNGRAFAILVIDIDNFKTVNDTHGHVVGDEVIRRVGEVLTNAVRAPDRVARVGGEEFIALVHEVGTGEARDLADRIRRDVGEAHINRDDLAIRVTVSIGVSLILASDRDIEDVVSRADAGLYEAKAAGRNRTVFRSGDESELQDIRAA